MRLRRSHAIGLLLEDPNNLGLHDPLHTEFLHGAAAASRELGYNLTVALTAPGETEAHGMRLVRERRADGLIVSFGGVGSPLSAGMQAITAEGVPLLLLQESMSRAGVFTVSAQDEVGSALAVEHLVELGHERLVFLCGEPIWPGPRRRRDGFLDAARSAGVHAEVWTCDAYTIEAARNRMAGTLTGSDRPTGIQAANDVIALGVIQQALEDGLVVGRDVSVVGFNDFDFSAWVRPTITTVRVPGAEMGARAVKLMVDAIEKGVRAESVAFRVDLVVRESTGPRQPAPRAAARTG